MRGQMKEGYYVSTVKNGRRLWIKDTRPEEKYVYGRSYVTKYIATENFEEATVFYNTAEISAAARCAFGNLRYGLWPCD